MVIAIGCLAPSPPTAAATAPLAFHLAGFLVWGLLLSWACSFRQRAVSSCLAPAAAYAIIIELLQAAVPARAVELQDLLANLLGLFLGAAPWLLPGRGNGGNFDG